MDLLQSLQQSEGRGTLKPLRFSQSSNLPKLLGIDELGLQATTEMLITTGWKTVKGQRKFL